MRKVFKNKFFVTALFLVFACTNSAYSQQPAAVPEPIGESGKPVGLEAPGEPGVVAAPGLVEGLNPYNLVIPEKFGKIEEIFQGGPGAPVIVHIQDAHANYEAQLNIKNILVHLSKNYNMSLVQLEGASSKLNPAVFETAYLKEANQKLADYLMREGRLSGAEAFAIEAEKPVELHGIENRMLYMENLRTFRSVYSRQAEISEYFKALRILAKDLRIKLLNEELLDLTRNMEAYAQEKIDLVDYLLYLDKLAERYKLASLKKLTEITRFPNLVRIMRLHELEKQLDEKQLKKESEAIKAAFLKKTSDTEVEELLGSLELKKKGMKPRAYFKKIAALAEQQGVDLLGYSQMRAMSEFLILQDEIEHHGLFSEVHRLEKIIQKKLFKTKDERHLIQLLKNIDLLEQYFKLEVSREKLAYVVRHYDAMRASYIMTEMEKLAEKLAVLPSDYKGDALKIDQIMDDVEYFYRVVLERDRMFVENVLAKTKSSGADRTILITGGFHTDGLTSLLKKQNVSYLVVIPKVDVKQGNEKYVKIMTEGDSEVGSVFAGTFAVQLELNSGNPLEHIGPAGPYVTLLRLVGHLGAGAAIYEAANRDRAVPDLTPQRQVSQRFNNAQPFIKVEPVKASFNADDESITVVQTDRLLIDGKVIETTFETRVNADGSFEIKAVSSRKLPREQARGADLRDLNVLRQQFPQAEALDNLPTLSEVLAQTLVPTAEVRNDEAPADIIAFGALIASPKLPRETLSILAGLQNNLSALQRVARLIEEGKPLSIQSLREIQAESQIANRSITAEDVEQGVTDTPGRETAKGFLALVSRSSVTVMVLPLLDTVSPEVNKVNKKELLSLLEVIQHNPGASAVVVGPDAENFTTREVNERVQDRKLRAAILSRIGFVETEAKDVVAQLADDGVAGDIQMQAFQAYQKIDRQLKIPDITPRTLVQDGYVKILLPGNEQGLKVGERLSKSNYLGNAVQLHSALERDGVRNNETQTSALADIQVKVMSILPKKFKAKTPAEAAEIDEFTESLNKIGLGGIVVQGANGWEIGKGIEALVSKLFKDFLVAREVAIRA